MFRILDISDETNPVEVGALKLSAGSSANYPGGVYDVKVRGDYAFVGGDSQHFFNVVDVSDLAAPSLVRSFGGSTYLIAAQIELYENHAYVLEKNPGGTGDRIGIYRIDDPANPVSLGSLSTISLLTSIAIGNGHLFVGLFYGTAGQIVRVYDLSNPSIPAPIGSLAVPGFTETRDLVVAGDHLYVAARINPSGGSGYGLLTVDISDPTAPFLTDEQVGFFYLHERQFAVSDGRLYVIDRHPEPHGWGATRGLYIYDIAQVPEAPVLLNTYRSEHGPYSTVLSAAPGRVYLWDKAEGLVIMDVTDPAAPRPLGKFHSPAELRRTLVDHSHLYVTDVFGGFTVLDVADTSRPRVLGNYLAKRHDVAGIGASGIDKVDDIVYLAAGSSGLLTVDVSDPARPHTLGAMRISSMAFPSSPWCGAAFQGLKVRDQVAYLGYYANFCSSHATYLLAVDVTDPFAPVAIGVAILFGGGSPPVHSLALGDGIVADSGRASIHGIANPTDPQPLHGPIFPLHPSHNGHISDVAIHESLRLFTAVPATMGALPAGVIDGLNIQDIGDPTSPVTISSVSLGEPMHALSVQHDSHRVYLRSQQSVLAVDISDPATPLELHRLTAFQVYKRIGIDSLVGLLADEPNLYATDPLGLTVLNVHDAVPEGAARTQGEGDHFFNVVDVSNLAAPSLVRSFATPDSNNPVAGQIELSGDYAYVLPTPHYLGSERRDIQVYRINDPVNPVSLGFHFSDTFAFKIQRMYQQ